MLYQTARSELQSPPPRLSIAALAYEAVTVILLGLALVWLI